MTRHPLSSTLTFALSASALIAACAQADAPAVPAGTETDNPVVDTASPSDFVPPGSDTAPGCPPPGLDQIPNLPTPPHSVQLPGGNGHVLAVGDYEGLRLIDMTDPQHPVTLGTAAVRGAVDGLLLSSTGQLWVAAEEDPIFPEQGLGTTAQLDPESHLIAFDVSDPNNAVRIAEATLGSGAVDLRERGGAVWALTPRLTPDELSCDAVTRRRAAYYCGFPSYEAVELHGFHAEGSALTEVAHAELPFSTRIYAREGGLATTFADGSVHVLPWDETGTLGTPLVLQLAKSPSPDLGAEGSAPGPVEIAAGQLSIVNVDGGRATLQVFDLSAPTAGPSRSSDLGAWTGGSGSTSLFDAGRLWLLSDYSVPNPVAIWDISTATPTPLALPAGFSFTSLLPISGATLGSASGAEIALGFDRSSGTSPSLFAIDAQGIRAAQPLTTPYGPNPNTPGSSVPAPSGLTGTGDSAAWQIVVRGAGLPLGLDPAPPPVTERILATVEVTAPSAAGTPSSSPLFTEASLLEPQSTAAVWPDPVLAITRGTSSTRFDVSPGAELLVSSGQSVVVIAEQSAEGCAQGARDCSGYAPGVEIFDVSGEPRRVAALPLPDLGLSALSNPNDGSLSWQIYDPLAPLSSGVRTALPMDTAHLAFVADVDLSCDSKEKCAALGITPVPFAQAGVIMGQIAPCPGNVNTPACTTQTPAPPTVYGMSHRQYFFVLGLGDAGGPAWHALGTSVLESNSGQPELASRFAAPVASSDTVAATRLERKSSAGALLPRGQARFMFDRFRLQPTGDALALPPVNVPGYPLVRLSETASAEQWLSVEPAPNTTGASTLHLLRIETGAAEIQQSLTLDASFGGLVALELAGGEAAALALTLPSNSCGTSVLSAVRRSADGAGIRVTSKLELPSDDWGFQATSGARALLQHGDVYAVVALSNAGELSVVALRGANSAAEVLRLLGTAP